MDCSVCAREAVSDRSFGLRVSREFDRRVFWLEGEQDIARSAVLVDALALALTCDGADLIVDLSLVTFIDAATIDVLVRARNRLYEEARSLTMRAPSSSARLVLEVCGLSGPLVT